MTEGDILLVTGTASTQNLKMMISTGHVDGEVQFLEYKVLIKGMNTLLA